MLFVGRIGSLAIKFFVSNSVVKLPRRGSNGV